METSITPENLEEDRGLIVRRSLLIHPGEASNVDYKASSPFVKGDDFSLKLVKHILGMANAGGGYLVIGYPENSGKHPEPGEMTDEILATYDVSTLASTVERYKSGTEKIDIKIHKDKNSENKKTYPIIEIGSFKSRPFFCKSSAGGILEENALYIRIAGARTIKVASPDEWDQLIDICLTKRQDETLRRFADLAREMGFPNSISSEPESSKKKLEIWIEESRAEAKIQAEKTGFKFEGLEITHSIKIDKTWNIKELLGAMETAILRNTGWPIGFVFHVEEHKPQPYKKGIRSIVASNRDSFDYWFLNEEGDFYFFRAFQEDTYTRQGEEKKREFWFDTEIWRISEGLEHILSLYKALGIDNTTKTNISISFFGINDRTIRASPGTGRHLFPRTSSSGVDSYQWEKLISIDALNVNIDQNIIEVSNGVFMMFNFTELEESVIKGVINEYRGNRK